MSAERDIKRALGGSVFLRDVRNVEPTKKGWSVGESIRLYVEEQGGYTLAFLKGTEERSRKTTRDKLDQAKIKYKAGPDYIL